MKKIVLLAMLLVMCVMSGYAQWSVTPEAGMTAVKRNSWGTSWKPLAKIGVGVEYQFAPGFFSLKSGLYYAPKGYESSGSGGSYYGYGYGGYWGYGYGYGYPSGYEYTYDYSNKVTRHFLQIPVMANFSFKLAEDVRLNLGVGPYLAVSAADRTESYVGYTSYNGGYGAYAPSYYGNRYNNLRAFDWGLTAAVGLEVKQWVFNAGYDLSLGQEFVGRSIGVNYHSLSLSIGYKFKFSR